MRLSPSPLAPESQLLNIYPNTIVGGKLPEGCLWMLMPLVSGSAASRTGWAQLCLGCLLCRAVTRPPAGILALGSPSMLEVVGSCCHPFSLFLPAERSQDSTAVALSDSSSTQDFFNEPTSSLEGSRKAYTEKRLPIPSSQPGSTGKDLPGATEERGMKT